MTHATIPVEFQDRVATAPELQRLAEAVDWLDHYDWATMPAALAASLHGVVAVADSRVVGAGRLVGDGVRYFYVQDVLVDPDYADHGIASSIVERLLGWIDRVAAEKPFIGLFSSPEAEGVYESLGFAVPEDMTGMHRPPA
jgi:GNAT superfamily N-acetyltransferase